MESESIKRFVKKYAEELGGEFNITPRGVPRIIMKGANMKISLVYAAKSQLWKAFYPFPAVVQEREYFETTKDLLKFLQEKGCDLG